MRSQIGAVLYERTSERVAYRDGYRIRRWDTRSGTIELKIPKVSAGAYFPSLLERRQRAEKVLHAVVIETYVKGVSTPKVDDPRRLWRSCLPVSGEFTPSMPRHSHEASRRACVPDGRAGLPPLMSSGSARP